MAALESKYFRYDIYQEQQKLLLHLASKFGAKALILYASPALENVNDLVKAKQRKCLIENTNFRPATELTGHHRNTYIKAGTYSIACSDPESMEQFDLLDQLEALKGNKNVNGKENVIEAANSVRNIAMRDSVFGTAYRRELNTYAETGLNEFPLLYSIISMSVFRELSGIQWVLAIDNK